MPPSPLGIYNKIVTVDQQGSVSLNLHTGQWKTMTSDARFVFMISGTQGGKTVTGPLWLYEEIKRLGSGDYLAVTSTWGLYKLKMLPAMLEYFCDVHRIGRLWKGAGIIEIADPEKGFLANTTSDAMYARIILRAVSSAAGLESATAKAAWLDECGQKEFKYEGWEAVQRRLSIHQGRVLGTTTPYNMGWLKTHVYDRWLNGDTDYDVIQFASNLNPEFPQEEFERAKATLPGWRFDMFYRALFMKPYGLIYKEYEEPQMMSDINSIDEVPSWWPVVVGVDFGGANNASVYLYENVDVRPTVYHVMQEFKEGNMPTKDHVANMHKRLDGRKRYRVVGGAPGETQSRMDWTREGIRVTQPPYSDIEVGISNVIELFKTNRLKVHPSLGALRNELSTYTRAVDAEGNVSDAIENKSEYHHLDALRYACSVIKPAFLRVGTFGRRNT